MSTGKVSINLTERLKPLDSCQIVSPDSIDASNNGRSGGVSFTTLFPSRLVLVDEEKHRQPD